MRNITARIIAPLLSITGFRFSKSYRHGVTLYHRVVYSIVDVVAANNRAD